MRKIIALGLLWTVATVMVAGCGGSSAATSKIEVAISPTTTTLLAGASTRFIATVTNDPSNKGVTWSASCATSSCGTISPTTTPSGGATTFTAPVGESAGLTVTVTAYSVASNAKADSATVTVSPISVSLSVSPAMATIQPGQSSQFVANVTGDSANQGVAWTASCGGSACGTVSPATTASGAPTTYTAPTPAPAGDMPVTLTATSVTNASASASASITVPGINIVVAPSSATVQPGATGQFSATVTGDATNQGVAWTVACGADSCGSVSPTTSLNGGVVTYSAPATQPIGDLSVTLNAASVANPAALNGANITVPGLDISVTVDLSTVPAGGTAQLTATVTNDAANNGVTWSITCASAPCGSVSPASTASGVPTTYTAPSSPPAADVSVTVTATSVTNTAATATANLTVPAITVVATPVGVLLPLNALQQFVGTVNYDLANAGVSWSLLDGGLACATACGTIAPSSTASGASTTYTPPASLPPIPLLSLVATSVTDTSKSATSDITLTTGSVQLVPNVLSFGTVVTGSSSAAKTVTVTNTKSAALTITGISIVGTDPTDFSQTNTCGATLPSATSCTISVIFKPTAPEKLSATVSIADSSSDSPQTVSLTGSGKTRRPFSLSDSNAKSVLSNQHVLFVPKPTGPNAVGTRVVEFVDRLRTDPYLANGEKRDLLIRLWYPALLNSACQPAEYTSARVWNYFAELVGVSSRPAVMTNSCLNAPVASGPYPVVVFSPGFTGTFTDYTFLFEDLASRGYVIASVDHTNEATAVEFPDGRFVKSTLGSYLGGPLRGDDLTLAFSTFVRVQDMASVLDELQRMNARTVSPFSGRLDMSRVGVAGHSLGGLTALLTVEHEPRFQTAIVIDGVPPGNLMKWTRKPVMLLTAGRENWDSDQCSLWNNLRGPRVVANLVGAEHFAPSDLAWISPQTIKAGPLGPDNTISAVRDSVASFLDETLRGSASESFSGSVASHSGLTVATQGQPQCGNANSTR